MMPNVQPQNKHPKASGMGQSSDPPCFPQPALSGSPHTTLWCLALSTGCTRSQDLTLHHLKPPCWGWGLNSEHTELSTHQECVLHHWVWGHANKIQLERLGHIWNRRPPCPSTPNLAASSRSTMCWKWALQARKQFQESFTLFIGSSRDTKGKCILQDHTDREYDELTATLSSIWHSSLYGVNQT